MKHLTKREMQPFIAAVDEQLALYDDWPRRRRNALRALIDLDPHWLRWLERTILPCQLPIQRQTHFIEWRARALLFKHYKSQGQWPAEKIFGDWPFTDRGNLSPG